MLQQTAIPESALPVDLDARNALRVFYRTNLLYPTLGPATAARYVGSIARVFDQAAHAGRVLERVRDHQEKFGVAPSIPIFDPPRTATGVRRSYMDTLVNPVRTISMGRVNVVAEGALKPSSATARAQQLAAARAVSARTKKTARTPAGAKGVSDAERQADEAAILQMLASPSPVMRDLFDRGVLRGEGAALAQDPELFRAEKVIVPMMERLAPRVSDEDRQRMNALAPLVDMAARVSERRNYSGIIDLYQSDPKFRVNVIGYVASVILGRDREWWFDGSRTGGIQLPSDVGINVEREWAFQRHEELQLALKTPVLRGPVSATPVSPNSRRVLTETETRSVREEQVRADARGESVTHSQTSISSSRFEQALDNLTEYGISDASSFANDSTLLSTLNEERRSLVESVAREISRESQTATGRTTETATGRSSEYTTEGKDSRLSTTEVGFDVVVPARATVRLNDVGLVWCPRVISPFMKLHDVVARYEGEQRRAYKAQNYVPFPVKPAIQTSEEFQHFEVRINGQNHIQTKDFVHTFELGPHSYVYMDGIHAVHRNGGSDDYDGGDFWDWWNNSNGDDLEHAVARVQNLSLSPDGRTLSGTAVLETNDPEWLNRSFIRIVVPIKTYTEESVAALAAYELQVREREMKLEAIASRADQYATLKRDELIQSYEDRIALQKEAFRALIARVFTDAPRAHRSYYEEVVSRCIDWSEATISFESQPMNDLPYRHLPPDHFMNCPAIRFFLPVTKSAETNFFHALRSGGITYHEQSAQAIQKYLEGYRGKISQWKSQDAPQLRLDQFDTEMVIGRHLEAVASRFQFAQ